MSIYQYYSGITSQVGFCATPLRLDSYNKCQFGCTYCFASTRQGHGRKSELKISNPTSLKNRLKRVMKGEINSALDEFIQQRIPFQLGGMSDPFTLLENKKNVTFEYLKILKEYNYPVIISTKSALISNEKYLDVIAESNCYVRFSTTVINEIDRAKIDKGCPSLSMIGNAAEKLAEINIPTSFRMQPIIIGNEYMADSIIDLAHSVGVKHISAEYLKVPIDANVKFGGDLKRLLNNNPISTYRELGALKVGREYGLPLDYRTDYLINMAIKTRQKQMTFGFADNDLLLHSDGHSCCNASNLYLSDSNFFRANIVSLAKNKKAGDLIYFKEYLSSWIPEEAVSTYLNSKARIQLIYRDEPEWLQYLKKMWIGELGVYSPNFFDGIEETSVKDEFGLPIFKRTKSDFELRYEEIFGLKTMVPVVNVINA